MRIFQPSLASRVLILFALFIGAQPSFQPFQADASFQQDNKLVSPKHVPETLALTGLSDKKDFSKSVAVGLTQDCPAAVRLTGTTLPVALVRSCPEASVLSFSHNRSPPFPTLIF